MHVGAFGPGLSIETGGCPGECTLEAGFSAQYIVSLHKDHVRAPNIHEL